MLNIFTWICNQSPELFHPAKLKIYTHQTMLHFSVSLLPGIRHVVLTVSMRLTTLDISSYSICLFVTGLHHLA